MGNGEDFEVGFGNKTPNIIVVRASSLAKLYGLNS